MSNCEKTIIVRIIIAIIEQNTQEKKLRHLEKGLVSDPTNLDHNKGKHLIDNQVVYQGQPHKQSWHKGFGSCQL